MEYRLTKKQMATKLEDLVKEQKHLEKTPMVQKMLLWQAMPQTKQNEIYRSWDEYHQNVRGTLAYLRFMDQWQAYKEGNMEEVKRLGQEARQELSEKTDWLIKPTTTHPDVFDRDGQCQR